MSREQRLKRYLLAISKHAGGIELIAPAEGPPPPRAADSENESLLEGVAEAPAPDEGVMATVDIANAALEKVKLNGMDAELAPEDMSALEAIILPKERPAVDVIDGDFAISHPLWLDLNADGNPDIHRRLQQAIPSVGRVELPGQNRIPYGGTAFVVGDGLLMTNRHVAEIFAAGPGGPLDFRPGWRSAIDFRRERGRPTEASTSVQVRRVRMIHPYWDVALLEVDGLPAGRGSLKLSLADVADLDGRRVAVIGYPAFDPERNDVTVQNELFSGVYGVKRLQPGMLTGRRDTASFRKVVSAATHDCSTLGGNSGSAVIDLDTGEVLALHFGGRYLETNYCVPAFELAKDGRVVDAGVKFAGTPAGGIAPWQSFWDSLETPASAAPSPAAGADGSQVAPPSPPQSPGVVVSPGGAGMTFTVPLTITIQLGAAGVTATAQESVMAIEEGLAEVWHDPDYADRPGYQEDFLGIPVPMPKAADPAVVAPLLDGSNTLRYRNFSVQMHAQRRIALFTASNVTAEAALRRPEPGRKYDRKSLTGLGPNDQEKWFPDPRLAAEFQLSDKFYTKDRGSFDKGHIVRRDDVCFGETYDLLRQGNGDTYHVTNCSPQVAQFNQSQRGEDNWGDLENLVLGEAASERYCLFSGPVLSPSDEIFTGLEADGTQLRLRIPKSFWKVVVAKRNDAELAAYAFVLDQDLSNVELEFVVPENFRKRMVSIDELERRTGVVFPAKVRDADQFDDDLGLELAFRAGIERTAVLEDEPEPEQVTPNSGDDAEAADEIGVPSGGDEALEAPRPWRLAEALKVMRAQINARAPNRSKASDGAVGDPAHQSRSSDHNPWVTDGGMGVVTAIDVTHDPAGGCDAGLLAEKLRTEQNKRIKYIIWNRRIANRDPISGAAAWAWRPYTGSNPHNHHVHISVRPDKALYDSRDPWRL